MRLEPIENPRNLLVKAAYRWSKRKFGKVLMPFKITYARKPQLMLLSGKMQQIQEKSVSLEPSLKLLIQTRVSMLNGCSFCNDLLLAQAVKRGLGADKFFALSDGTQVKEEVLTAREQAVVAFVDQYAGDRMVTNETFDTLRQFFSEIDIIEIVALNAFEQYFNALAIPLGIESDGLRASEERHKDNVK